MSREPSRAEIRRRQRQALIIAAAEDQLGEAGIAGTTLEKVGERVGLSRGALYYYVESREDLLALVLDDVLREIRADADARAEGDADPLHRLECFARAHVHTAVERAAGQLVVANVDLLAAHERSAELLHQHEMVARDHIQTAVDQGQLPNLNLVVASTVFFGALNTLCRTYNPKGELTLDQMIDATLDLTLRGWVTLVRTTSALGARQ
ncbi:MAG: TetR/AcrR family transcriptional regulator [Myxococcales bacterium]|nr:TetR/AcrR family transcriptional regulator [Myxococcales bacterium]